MPTQPTTVVNITRGAAFDIYIGRPGKGRRGPWGNPFIIGKDGTRAEVIAKYARWIAGQPQLLARLPELQGKRLGCFCAPGSFMRRNLTMQDEDRWSADKVNLLITWWPHFGTYYIP